MIQLWYCHANAVRTCRDPQQFGLPSWEKDEKTSSLLKRILTFNCYRLLQFQLNRLLRLLIVHIARQSQWIFSGQFHGFANVHFRGPSLSQLCLRCWRWKQQISEGRASPATLERWTFGFRNNFFKVWENTEIARLYKLSKLHKTAMIYEYNVVLTVASKLRSPLSPPVSFQCCARTGSPQSGIPQLSGSVPGSLKLQRMSSQPCCAASWSHPQSLPCNKTYFRTAIEQSYGSYWIYNSTWPYKVEACIHMYTCAQDYTKLHQHKAKISIFHKVSLLCSLCIVKCAKLLLMHDHDGVDSPGITLEPQSAMKELFLTAKQRSWKTPELSHTLTYSHWLSQLFISVHRNFRPALHLKSFESFINHLHEIPPNPATSATSATSTSEPSIIGNFTISIIIQQVEESVSFLGHGNF